MKRILPYLLFFIVIDILTTIIAGLILGKGEGNYWILLANVTIRFIVIGPTLLVVLYLVLKSSNEENISVSLVMSNLIDYFLLFFLFYKMGERESFIDFFKDFHTSIIGFAFVPLPYIIACIVTFLFRHKLFRPLIK